MSIIRNISILYAWQFGVLFIPILMTPFLTRSLGIQSFGTFALVNSITSYFLIFIDWGFAYTATRQVAQNSSNTSYIRSLFWNVLWGRVVLALISIVIINLLIYAFEFFGRLALLLYIAQIQLLFAILSFDWLLRGLEKMTWFALVSLSGRILVLPFIFILVKTESDLPMAIAIQSGAAVASGIVSGMVIWRLVHIFPIEFRHTEIWSSLKDSASLFISTAGISLYAQSSALVLGLVSSPYEIGIFSGADRIRRGAQALIGPVSGALFPRINSMVAGKDNSLKVLFIVFLLGQGGFGIILSVLIVVFSDELIYVFLGADFFVARASLMWLSPIPTFVAISNICGTNFLITFGLNKTFMYITLGSGGVGILMLAYFGSIYGAVGAAAATMLTEALVTFAMMLVVLKNRHYIS